MGAFRDKVAGSKIPAATPNIPALRAKTSLCVGFLLNGPLS